MGWILRPLDALVLHNGSKNGFSSILVISKKRSVAVVSMTDTGIFKFNESGNVVMDESMQEAAIHCLNACSPS